MHVCGQSVQAPRAQLHHERLEQRDGPRCGKDGGQVGCEVQMLTVPGALEGSVGRVLRGEARERCHGPHETHVQASIHEPAPAPRKVEQDTPALLGQSAVVAVVHAGDARDARQLGKRLAAHARHRRRQEAGAANVSQVHKEGLDQRPPLLPKAHGRDREDLVRAHVEVGEREVVLHVIDGGRAAASAHRPSVRC